MYENVRLLSLRVVNKHKTQALRSWELSKNSPPRSASIMKSKTNKFRYANQLFTLPQHITYSQARKRKATKKSLTWKTEIKKKT